MEQMTAAQAEEEFARASLRADQARANLDRATERSARAEQQLAAAKDEFSSACCWRGGAIAEATAADAALLEAYHARQRARGPTFVVDKAEGA